MIKWFVLVVIMTTPLDSDYVEIRAVSCEAAIAAAWEWVRPHGGHIEVISCNEEAPVANQDRRSQRR